MQHGNTREGGAGVSWCSAAPAVVNMPKNGALVAPHRRRPDAALAPIETGHQSLLRAIPTRVYAPRVCVKNLKRSGSEAVAGSPSPVIPF